METKRPIKLCLRYKKQVSYRKKKQNKKKQNKTNQTKKKKPMNPWIFSNALAAI